MAPGVPDAGIGRLNATWLLCIAFFLAINAKNHTNGCISISQPASAFASGKPSKPTEASIPTAAGLLSVSNHPLQRELVARCPPKAQKWEASLWVLVRELPFVRNNASLQNATNSGTENVHLHVAQLKRIGHDLNENHTNYGL